MLKARDIHKSFGSLEVLKGVDFEAEKGDVIAIVGASGAGKTTFLQVLGTLLTPDSGSLEIDGEQVLSLPMNARADFRCRKIGFVFQAHHLLPEFSALENVMIPALIEGRGVSDAEAAAKKLLGEVGLSERLSHKPSELSGGEQQRVAIARALVNSPAVVFADEPTGNLDSVTKQEIHRLFFDLRDKFSQTIIIVTHDPQLASICDRSLTMVDGRF
ncbi:MAG: ABC transporter ATP-binding protein [Bacteroidales bacterium]|nr:ABC transporter ATP-binding protein [Bacteroidales bacterium]